jgi:ribosomal protection tetracycline resistance protein
MKKLVIGILAHVDAGKTTLSEGMLYLTGKIKKPGRVDRRDTYLDTHALERERGITIFSKQALMDFGDCSVTLLDTPGHVDFSSETERAMQVLDYAIVVVSGTDGVQAHTETLWRLLKRYGVPAFIFVTKMDVGVRSRDFLMDDIRARLGGGCVDFTSPDPEEIAMCSESALERFAAAGELSDGDTAELIRKRELFPCFFGSGLKLDGVEEFLKALDRYTIQPAYPDKFAARVFKIARDSQGNRLTYMKITGGSLAVRASLPLGSGGEAEKVTQIRLYSGIKFDTADIVYPGTVCAVTGLSATRPGEGLGAEPAAASPVLEPVLSYRIVLPKGADPLLMLPRLRELEDEDPMLRVVWNESLREIHVQLMGRIQVEILKSLILERFGVQTEVDSGRIMYRETIRTPAEGVGHFEPLRHYAEVHLLLEPLERGAGLVFAADCPEDVLDKNWQRLILTHLEERQHVGVLTGSPITDMKITLIAGRAHIKHTEGGDFRQATYRAVRQGLMCAESVLLEPYYAFRLEVPSEQLGRAINDVRAMGGVFSAPGGDGETSVIEGRAPVAAMGGYAADVAAYTRGRGRLVCSADGYEECKNPRPVIDAIGYNPEADLENTPDSVFCAHGAGFTVKWDQVTSYMHVDTGFGRNTNPDDTPIVRMCSLNIDEKELEAIMDREFGPIRRPMYTKIAAADAQAAPRAVLKKEYLIVDGYNVIFAWDELSTLAGDDLSLARHRLMDTLANYRGYTKCELVLVFDAYKVPGGEGSRSDWHGIHVAFTKQGETCDAYIEKLASDIGKNYSVRVISSDSLIQLSAFGSGVLRQTVWEFKSEVDWVLTQIESAIARMGTAMHGEKLGDRLVKKDGEQ